MQKRFGKRGQEGVSVGTIIGIVIAVVAAIVIIVGFTGGFNTIFSKFDVAPSTLEAKAQVCQLAFDNNLKSDFCVVLTKLEIAGSEQYVTCAYLKSVNLIEIERFEDKENNDEKFCGEGDKILAHGITGNGDAKAEAFCKNNKLTKDIMVDGQSVKCGDTQ